jgi:hypothetical protein
MLVFWVVTPKVYASVSEENTAIILSVVAD